MRPHGKAINILALVIGFLMCGGCHVLEQLMLGRQGMAVSRSDFTNGTTRHPREWDDAAADTRECAEDKITKSSIANASVEELFSGGIWIVDASELRQYNNGLPADAVYTRTEHKLRISTHAYRLRPVFQHEVGHALSDLVPALRNPVDPLGVSPNAGNLDHVWYFFLGCIEFNPGVTA